MADKVLDPEEKLRAAAVSVVYALVKGKHMDVLQQVDTQLLQAVGARCRDKRQLVRHEAIKTLGKLYGLVFADLVTADTTEMHDKYAWIPQLLVEAA